METKLVRIAELAKNNPNMKFTSLIHHLDYKYLMKSHHDLPSNKVAGIIGEATKNIPDHIRRENPQIEWRKMAGMRDMMIHGYFSVNYRIVWDVVQNKIPTLKQQIKNYYKCLKHLILMIK